MRLIWINTYTQILLKKVSLEFLIKNIKIISSDNLGYKTLISVYEILFSLLLNLNN